MSGKRNLLAYATAIGAVIAASLLLRLPGEHVNSTTVALTLLLIVLVEATFFGRNPALLASLAAMLSFNYNFLPPIGTWHVADPQNLIAWAAFTITAIVAGELSSYARRRARESERLYDELQTAFKTASEAEGFRQSEKLKSALLDAVTHDLRTPLTSIKASVTTLLDSEGGHRTIELAPDGRREFLDIINEETDRLNHFIEGMVDLARIEAGANAAGDSSATVDEIVAITMERAAGLGPDIRVNADEALPRVAADARALGQVLYNLVENAVKHSPPNSHVDIGAGIDGDRVVLSVTDQGPGIPEKMREQVFEKFYRLDGRTRGLGLGLAIAKGIVEAQGGTIRIEDGDNNMGTRVVVSLPAADDGR